MDGGVQLLGLAPDATRLAEPRWVAGSTMAQLRQGHVPPRFAQHQATHPQSPTAPPASPTGWASLLTARVKQVAGLDGSRPVAPGAEEGWASRLKAHALRSGWDRVEQARAVMPAADPIAIFATALNLLREQLERERHRADAAEHGGQARIAAAEARAAQAERQLQEVQAVLSRRDGELGAAQGRITSIEGHLAGAMRCAEKAEGEAKEAKSELRRLRSRGLWARIFNAA